MMIKHCRTWTTVGAIAVAAVSVTSISHAQVFIGRGRGLIINAPGVAIRLGQPRAYGYGYAGPPRLLGIGPNGLRPGLAATPSTSSATPWAAPPARRFAARPTTSPASIPDETQSLPTADQLRGMSDSALLNGVVGLAARLDGDLGQFSSAASWREYVRLPDGALPAASQNQQVRLRMNAIVETLGRFQSATANSEYRQITSTPSYAAMQSALGEVVRRYGGESPEVASARPTAREAEIAARAARPLTPPQAVQPASAEQLPAPQASTDPQEGPALVGPQNQPEPEHSILSK